MQLPVRFWKPAASCCYQFLLLLVMFTRSLSFPSSRLHNGNLPGAMMYLMKYGYMDSIHSHRSANLLSQDGLRNYLMDFQAFAGIPITGQLDSQTITVMNMPRCGVKDKVGKGAHARKKRYALQGSRWKVNNNNITYKISKYPTFTSMDNDDVDEEIAKSFEVWSSVSDLKFTHKRSGSVHIDIRFEDGEHGDGDPFDGEGGTLAHAYFPIYGGDAHFDNGDYWTMHVDRGTNLYQTAAHEFGHSLGLSHSEVPGSLMAPFYKGFEETIKLDEDDMKAITALYGEKKEKQPPKPLIPRFDPVRTTRRPSTTTEANISHEELCNNASIDAIVTVEDKTTYTFKGDAYWKLSNDAIAPGYPRSIATDWDLPGNLDAAFTWTNGKTYIFKGKYYWRFSNMRMDPNYPKLIEKGFEGIPNNIDAAFVWSGNGKIYFFKGAKYWRFDPETQPPVKFSYPKAISSWEGLPDYIDDALQYSNGYTYFFKAGLYYRFDDRLFRVDRGTPEFPRPAGYWWFGCQTIPALDEGSDGYGYEYEYYGSDSDHHHHLDNDHHYDTDG
eukprot:TRINITY_DN30787_c0_g1_i10.p1 TRINITY_DN30787_c0_g1~~TRINITY_DN30787_c0_g1_i10.p1  ORF type:complete len:554 (-),score=76.57 TRINITY_DN30787_c0_g1_i10:161-1822(-)